MANWHCNECENVNAVNDTECAACGAKRSRKFSPQTAEDVHPERVAKSSAGKSPDDPPVERAGAGRSRMPIAIGLIAVAVAIIAAAVVLRGVQGSNRPVVAVPSTTTTTTGHPQKSPSSTASTTQSSPAPSARILAANGSAPVSSGGPTSLVTPFGQADVPAAVGSQVTLTCALFGQGLTVNGGSSKLWIATSQGWFNSLVLSPSLALSSLPACTGSVTSPQPGTSPPTIASGPYPVVTDSSALAVTDAPNTSANQVASLTNGDLVTLICSQVAQFVQAPNVIANEGSNNQWDKIQSPVGWVPDSWVDSQSNGSVAPPC